MYSFDAFCKACPESLRLTEKPDSRTTYKYYLVGKGCVLGVLFEDSVALYFEWIAEQGAQVRYPPRLRYKAWPKREVARLIRAGVWEAETVKPSVRPPVRACISEGGSEQALVAPRTFWLN